MEKVADLLTRKYPQFNTAVSNCLVSDALYQMSCENVDYLIVMKDNKFKGIITEHDIASKILYENRPLNKIEVKEFMNVALPVATPDASLQSCMQLMERFNVRHLVIYEQFEFKGVISTYDLMQEALNNPDSFFVETEPPRRGYPWNY
jgi:signal-transduction protein with cAMP-binding, CBS, and nucleotidyltransferase domain